ncbi:MAG: hypothetical protein U0234_20120 [Sandaracinus sp.]
MSSSARSLTARVASLFALLALAAAPSLAEAQYVVPGPPIYGSVSISIGDYSPGTLRGVAGGPISLSAVDGSCRGTASVQPSHVITVSGGALRISVRSGSDSTLMVLLPDGRRLCNDDTNGLDAQVDTSTVSGPVYVWVGSYSGGTFPYDLTVSQIGGPPAMPSIPSAPLFGTLDLGGRWSDPTILAGRFGGPVQASSMFPGCRGYITPQPSHVVMVPTYMPSLRFVVAAPADTTMIVQYADGSVQCDDDSGGGMNPIVQGDARPGPIRVWVGAYSSSSVGGGYQLGVTTIPGIRYDTLTAPVVVAPPPVVVAPPPVVVAPPPVVAPPVIVAPPSSAIRVTLSPRVPVTLYAPGITTPTVAVWQPRGGQPVEFATQTRGSMLVISATIAGAATQLVEIPAALASTAVVTSTRRPDGRVLFRAERAPEGSDPGQQMLLLVDWDRATSAPTIAQQWIGTFTDRAPGWSR